MNIWRLPDDEAFGAATTVRPKIISHTFTAVRWTCAPRNKLLFAYALPRCADNPIIVDVEGMTTVQQAESAAVRWMVGRTENIYDLTPRRFIAGIGYGSAAMVTCSVEEKGIESHIPDFDKSKRIDGTLSRKDLHFYKEADCYICPQRKLLSIIGILQDNGQSLMYRGNKRHCDNIYPLKPYCCLKPTARVISRGIYETARDVARDIVKTDSYAVSQMQGKKLKCSSLASKGFYEWAGYASAAQSAPKTSISWWLLFKNLECWQKLVSAKT